MNKHKIPAMFLAVAVFATAVRLFMCAGMFVQFSSAAIYDDILQVQKAFSSVSGQWLGEFGPMTLVKGVGYPLLTAFFSAIHIPYIFAYHLLYTLACLLFVYAVSPVVKNNFLRLLLYVFLLFNPIAFSGQITRFYRDIGYYSVAFIAISAALGLMLRAQDGKGVKFFAVFTGASLAFACMFREDSQWLMVYTVACVLVFGAVRIMLLKKQGFKKAAMAASAVAVAFALCMGAVSLVNFVHYGVFTADDYNTGPFAAAYGAISRLNNEFDDPSVTIYKAQRLQLYELSPAFAELKEQLDGESLRFQGFLEAQGEYKTGYFSFFMRYMVADIGYYTTAQAANEYYTRLADEVNALCDSGAVAAGPKRSGVVARFYPWMAGPIAKITVEEIFSVLHGTGLSQYAGPASEDDVYLKIYENFAHATIAADRYYEGGSIAANYNLSGVKLLCQRAAGWCIRLYQLAMPPLFFAAVIVFLAYGFFGLAKRIAGFAFWAPWLAAASLLSAFIVRCAMLAYVTVGSFSTLGTPSYEAACYPVLLAFIGMGLCLAAALLPMAIKRPAKAGA